LEQKDRNTLFLIPDINGFKKFVNETAIKHSRMIITKLLENIIDSNRIDLEVAEVEGDAVFFYRLGGEPAFVELIDQAKIIYSGFHSVLKDHELYNTCECDACKSAKDLKLKIIVHYGKAQIYSIKNFSRLIGKDVITVHMLLKNNVPLEEYILITENLAGLMKPENNNEWLNLINGEDTYDEIGKICYRFSNLSQTV
jgi:hypothetical protein